MKGSDFMRLMIFSWAVSCSWVVSWIVFTGVFTGIFTYLLGTVLRRNPAFEHDQESVRHKLEGWEIRAVFDASVTNLFNATAPGFYIAGAEKRAGNDFLRAI